MISPKDVEPFDAAAKRTIATWEKTIDEKLQKDRVWFHSYTHANSRAIHSGLSSIQTSTL